MEEEIWKNVPWYEWLYSASQLWNIKSLERIIVRKNNTSYKLKWRILSKMKRWNNWYYCVDLCKLWKINSLRVNRIIWATFLWLDINDTKLLMCHIDDNIYNNNINNLFIWTSKDNSEDMVSKKRQWWFQNSWEWNWMNIYSNELVINIIDYYNKWFSIKQISNIYKIKYWTVYSFVSWKRRSGLLATTK